MNNHFSSKCIVPISMIYVSVMICTDLFIKKSVLMPFGYSTAATFIFPLWFVFNDVIAEVYGYKVCWKILLTGFIAQTFFNLLCLLAIHLPSPPNWSNQSSFDLIFGNLFRIEFSTLAAFLISGFINIRLITKWKILMCGKHFWLRSIGSSIIAEVLYSSISIWPILLGSMPLSKIPMIMFWSCVLKLIYTITLAYPAMLLVQLIKRMDGIDIYDDSSSFNPFMKDISLEPDTRI